MTIYIREKEKGAIGEVSFGHIRVFQLQANDFCHTKSEDSILELENIGFSSLE